MTDFINGFDLSTLDEVERCRGKFYRDGKAQDAMDILRDCGGNFVRLRLWNDPYDAQGQSYGAGVCDLPTVLSLAHRAKARGMGWLLDFHYSDFWADPGKQTIPKAWQGLTLPELEQAVYRYTLDVLCACRAYGVTPNMVQVGNEITNGLLWPYGKVSDFDGLTRLVSAGVRAVREFDPQIAIMIHLDNGGNNGLYRRWFDEYFARGGECDVIGLSYYPQWHGTLSALESNLADLAQRYGKPLIIAETSCYHTVRDYAAYEKLSPENRKGAPMKPELLANVPFPISPEGQADFLRAILGILRRVPNGLGAGFFWWEAAWVPIPGSGWAKKSGWEYVHEHGPGGNEWANQALFDFDGSALPALDVIRAEKQ